MKRLMIGLLIAATALTPMLAHAQEQRLERPEDFTEGLPDRPSRQERQERRAERAERRAERAAATEPTVQRPRREDRSDRRLDGDGMEEARPDGMFRRRSGQIFPPTPEQRREARQERREDRLERRENRRERRQVGTGAIGADFLEGRLGRRDDRFERREDRLERREDRLERRNDRRDRLANRGGWYGADGGFDWDRDTYRDGRVWNRGWRDDRRYDWNGHRRHNQGLYRLPRYYPPYGYRYDYRRFGLGASLSRSLFAPSYWIDDPWAYRLPPAYGPYRWIRYYDDALLIDLRTGRVVDMVYGIFF